MRVSVEDEDGVKSPEQIPPNPLYHTEFLPMYTSKPHSKPHFSPQNLLSLFLHSSTFLFIFCAIIHSQKMLFFFPFSGCPSLNYNPQNDFIASFRYLHIKHWLYSHFCSTARAARSRLFAPRHTPHTNKTTMKIILYDASTTTTTMSASPIVAGHPCHCHDRRYGAGHCFKTSKLYLYRHG